MVWNVSCFDLASHGTGRRSCSKEPSFTSLGITMWLDRPGTSICSAKVLQTSADCLRSLPSSLATGSATTGWIIRLTRPGENRSGSPRCTRAAGPHAIEMQFPTLLEQEPPLILAYRPEFVVAEKLEAMIVLGTLNSRLKDYHDLWRMMRTMDISDSAIVNAVRMTFQRRKTTIPDGIPEGLTEDFARDEQKQRMWAAFIARSGLDVGDASLVSVVHDLREDLVPLLAKARKATPGVPD